MFNSVFFEDLGVKYPIIQGGMAWVADSSLASAVSNAGGLGIIAAANAPVDYIRDEIRKAKKLTDKPLNKYKHKSLRFWSYERGGIRYKTKTRKRKGLVRVREQGEVE